MEEDRRDTEARGGVRDTLRELQTRLDAAFDELGPKVRKAFEELDNRVDAAVADLKPRAQSAMKEMKPRVDAFVADVQPRIDSVLERLQARIEELRHDLDERAARSSQPRAPIGEIGPGETGPAPEPGEERDDGGPSPL